MFSDTKRRQRQTSRNERKQRQEENRWRTPADEGKGQLTSDWVVTLPGQVHQHVRETRISRLLERSARASLVASAFCTRSILANFDRTRNYHVSGSVTLSKALHVQVCFCPMLVQKLSGWSQRFLFFWICILDANVIHVVICHWLSKRVGAAAGTGWLAERGWAETQSGRDQLLCEVLPPVPAAVSRLGILADLSEIYSSINAARYSIDWIILLEQERWRWVGWRWGRLSLGSHAEKNPGWRSLRISSKSVVF